MRKRGRIEEPVGLVPGDHVCWVIEDDDALVETVTPWITDGVARNERVVYLSDAPEASVRQELAGIGDLPALVARRQVVLGAAQPMYNNGPVDELGLLTWFAAVTAEALADGYAGVRVAALNTDMTDQATIDAFLSWEQLADAFMNRAPVSALCMFDRRSVSDAAIITLGAAHPACHGLACTTSFRLHAHEDGWRLAGDLDTFERFRLEQMLRNAAADGEDVVLHLADLHHASGGCTTALRDFASRQRESGGKVVFKDAPPAFRGAWAAMGFDRDAVVFA